MPEDGRSKGGKRRWPGIPSNLLKAADAAYPLLPFPLFLASLPAAVVVVAAAAAAAAAAASALVVVVATVDAAAAAPAAAAVAAIDFYPISCDQGVVKIHLYYTPNNSKIHFCCKTESVLVLMRRMNP